MLVAELYWVLGL